MRPRSVPILLIHSGLERADLLVEIGVVDGALRVAEDDAGDGVRS